MEIEVRAVRLVRQHEHPRRVRKLHDLDEVGADAVVGGVVDENRLSIGMLRNRLLNVRDLHAERDAEAFIAAWVHVNRDGTVHDERVDGAPVDVARQDDLLAAPARGPDHGLHRRGGAVHHEERVVRAERLRRELLRILDHRNRMSKVVEGLHGIDVERHAELAEIVGELRVHPATLMPRNVKMREPVDALRIQRVRERRLGLPHAHCIFRPRRYGSCHLIDHPIR